MIITIVGYFGFANAGDEAILAGMLHCLRAAESSVRVRVICGDVPSTERDHGVEAVYWQDMTAISRAIQTSDLLVIGGGGLFHDYWGADPDTLLTSRHWGLAFYTSCAFVAHLNRKPVMLYAVGVGPLVSSYGKRLTRTACDIAARITVRDDASRALLVSIGVSAAKIEVTADPAFSIPPLLPATVEPRRRPVLGVAIRRWAIGVHPPFLERELAFALDWFIDQTGGSVVFVPFQALPGTLEDDIAASQGVLDNMRMSPRATISRAVGWRSAFETIHSCDAVLGMRLHSVIFSALAGVPFLAVSYDTKVDTIARQLNLKTTVIDVTGLDAAQLTRALIETCKGVKEAAFRPEPFIALNSRDASAALSLAGVEPLHYSLDNGQVNLLSRSLTSLYRETDNARKEQQELTARNRTLLRDIEAAKRLSEDQLRAQAAAREFRTGLVSAIEAYQRQMESDLAVFRSQKAWQAMLAIRKAYTLFQRSKAQFLRFALGAMAYRFGSLREYDLPFPDLRRFTGNLHEQSDRAGYSAPTTPQQGARYDVIVLGIIDFDFRFQRPQQIAVEMARRGHRVFWVSPSRFIPPSSASLYSINTLRENIWEVNLRCAGLDVYNGELNADVLPDLVQAVTALLLEAGSAESIAYVQLPFWRRLALELRKLSGSKVLYDCMDDWDTFQNVGRFNIIEEQKLASEADLLVVTGAEIERKFLSRDLKPLLIRNGADYAAFSKAERTHLLDDVKRPIVGYFGAIADWIDLGLVEEVAQLRPQYTFVLVGQVFDRDIGSLEALPNVHLLGGKPYSEIPSYLYLFDACIIPFLLNAVTKATDPVKLYEYLSLGKPVVATAMAELEQCGNLIYIGHNPADFAAQLDRALSESDDSLVEARIDFAKANTWSERVDKLAAGVRSLYPLVSILIVTYNSEEFVRACIDSIVERTAYPNYEIVLVDNGSTDRTAALIRQYAAGANNIRVFCLTENTGFAAGNNHAAQAAGGEFLLFLNIDTVVTNGWVHRLLRHLENDPLIGLICPVTNFAGNEVKVDFAYATHEQMQQFAARRAVTNVGQELDIQSAPLFCALVPRTVWNQVGNLDVSFGMGMFEDDDFSLRVRQAGFRVTTAEDCFIHHFGQGSFAKLSSQQYNLVFKNNQHRFEEKWGAAWQPHRHRVGTRSLAEERRFQPVTFFAAKPDAEVPPQSLAPTRQ